MKLPLVPLDKSNHFIYGFTLYSLLSLINKDLALTMVFIAAIGKECYDFKSYGKFDLIDILFTVLPAVILYLKG